MTAACSSFLFAFITACKLVESGAVKRLLLCGGDKMSTITDYEDRTQAMLFGDAAAVVLIEESNDPDCGIIDFISRIDPALHLKMILEAQTTFVKLSKQRTLQQMENCF